MRLVVADTSPLFYLLSIQHINLLPQLFGSAFIPEAVRKELSHPEAPKLARDWAADLPSWIEVAAVDVVDDAALQALGARERAEIGRAHV